jgi:hypothetical protein
MHSLLESMRQNQVDFGKRWNTGQKGHDEEFTDCLREYMVLSETFHAAMSFKDFCTIKHPEWYEPQVSVDKKVKVPRKKVLVSEDFDASKNEDRLTIDNIAILSRNHRPKPPPSTLTLTENYSKSKP